MNTKLEAVLGSRNFLVSILTLIGLFVTGQGLDWNVDNSALANQLVGQHLSTILVVLGTNIGLPIVNLVRKAITTGLDTSILKSVNFITHVLSAVLIGVSVFGIMFPDGAAADLVNSIAGGQITVILTAIVVNLVNPIIHFLRG